MDRNTRGREFVIKNRDTILGPVVVTATFPINNLYAIILFNLGDDKIFITPTFRQLLNHESSKLDVTYEGEMANGQIWSVKEILVICLLIFNNHTFHVNLMQMTTGRFNVITIMDWLSPYCVEILCYENSIWLPLPNGEALIIHVDKSGKNL